jgi:hypothetical protein
MKKIKEMMTDKQLDELLKAYLRTTGDLIPRYPEEVRAFEKRKTEMPEIFNTADEDPAEILRKGYVPYESVLKNLPAIPDTPVESPLSYAARHCSGLSQDTLNKINDQLDEDQKTSDQH